MYTKDFLSRIMFQQVNASWGVERDEWMKRLWIAKNLGYTMIAARRGTDGVHDVYSVELLLNTFIEKRELSIGECLQIAYLFNI